MTTTKNAAPPVDDGSFSWQKAMVRADLSARAKHTGLTVHIWMNQAGRSSYPSIDLLAECMSRNRKYVMEGVAELEAAGWLQRRSMNFRGAKHRQQEYVAAWPGRTLADPDEYPAVRRSSGHDAAQKVGPSEGPKDAENLGPFQDEVGPSEGQRLVPVADQQENTQINTQSNTQSEREARDARPEEAGEGEVDQSSEPDAPTPDAPTPDAKARKAAEAEFRGWWSGWPTYQTDSEPLTRKAWAALTAEERTAAAAGTAAYLAASKAAGRTKVCAAVTYLNEKRWERLTAEQTGGSAADGKPDLCRPFSVNWWADRVHAMASGSAFRQRYIDRAADEGKAWLPTMDWKAQGYGFHQVAVDSDEWRAFLAEHERRGWPLPPIGDRQWAMVPDDGILASLVQAASRDGAGQ